MKNNKVRVLVEGAIMVALAFVLSMIKIFKFPWGGSITVLSMLPIIIISIRNGVESGLACAFVYSITQLAQGIIEDGLLGWGLTQEMLLACIFLDYVGAFTVLGLAGLFRKKDIKGWIGGAVMAIALRYIMHVISGAVVFASAGMLWEGLNIDNPWLYSLAYNACYMLPEMILTTIGAVLLFKTKALKMILTGAFVKEEKMVIIGSVLMVIGSASTAIGVALNNSIEEQVSSILENGSANPGTIWIIAGAVAAAIGLILMIIGLIQVGKEEKMVIAGIILIAIGAGSAVVGAAQNKSIRVEDDLTGVVDNVTVNPGAIWIYAGIVVAGIGLALAVVGLILSLVNKRKAVQ